MSAITSHVLDTVLGKPAAAVPIKLARLEAGSWTHIAESATDADGRCRDLAPDASPGVYLITFFTAAYLLARNRTSLYPEISITFTVGAEPHYHLPLLLSDNSYTTYRGS